MENPVNGIENLGTHEVIVPANIAKPLGEWLSKNLSNSINKAKDNLNPNIYQQEPFPKTWLSSMQEAAKGMLNTQNSLRNAREVKLKLSTSEHANQWEFVFSKEEEKKDLEPVKLTLTKPFVNNLISALSDSFINSSNVLKFSELIQLTSNSETVKISAGEVLQSSEEIEKTIGQFLGADEIRIEVDEQGKVKIAVVKKTA